MLCLLFHAGEERFIVDSKCVTQVIPWVKTVEDFNDGSFLIGLINFRGELVPLIDFCKLHLDQPASSKLSTRIIILNLPRSQKMIGIIAEKVIDVLDVDMESVIDNPLLEQHEAYITGYIKDIGRVIKVVDVSKVFDCVEQLNLPNVS